jgi:nitrite reductase (NADH) small subunit
MMNAAANNQWQAVCASEELVAGIGVRALLEGKQVALFRVKNSLYALDAIDPFTRAAVIARGLVGSIGDRPVVASPLYKQHFDLQTGVCLEDESVRLQAYPVRERDGVIELRHCAATEALVPEIGQAIAV